MSPWRSWLGLLSWCSIVKAIRCIRKISSKGAKSSNELLKLDFMIGYQESDDSNWPLAWYLRLRVAHAPGMPGTFSPPPRVSDPDMHHGTGVTHVTLCMSGSLFGRWRGKRSRHSRRMRNPQFNVSGKKPMAAEWHVSLELQVLSWSHIEMNRSGPKCSDINLLDPLWETVTNYLDLIMYVLSFLLPQTK